MQRGRVPASACRLPPERYRADRLDRGQMGEALLTPADLRRSNEHAFFNNLRGWLRAACEAGSWHQERGFGQLG